MKFYLPILFCILLQFGAGAVRDSQAEERAGETSNCPNPGGQKKCGTRPAWCRNETGQCNPEMRGQCGKRRGDWYGARQPVANISEARTLLLNYFAGHEYKLSEVTEKKWGFIADIQDKNGAIIDRVMVDKRFGRIRTLY